jgi:hypothetical protein
MHIVSVQYNVSNWVYFLFFFFLTYPHKREEVWIRTSDIRFIRRGNKTKQNIEGEHTPIKTLVQSLCKIKLNNIWKFAK